MNIVCVICSDLLVPSDDIFHTPCGHIFHFACVTQWLERSKTCPQCREKTTLHKIHRIYFNFANSDTISEDTCSLQDKIDKLNFQLMLKETDNKHDAEKIKTLEKQTNELKKEVRKVEREINEKSSAIYALKEQIKYFQEQNVEVVERKKEIEQLQKKIENYKNIQVLLEASAEDVDQMISSTCNPNTLITYISVMKREMTIGLNKRRELRAKVRSLQQELTKVSMERNFLSEEHAKGKKFEEDLLICESEKMFLQNELRKLQKEMSLKQKLINSKIVNISNTNSNNDLKQNEIEKIVHNAETGKEDIDQEVEIQSTITKKETSSPYLPVKSRGVFALKQHVTQKHNTMKLSSSILKKKSRVEQADSINEKIETNIIAFNGFGGHSKLEKFPSPVGIKVNNMKDDITKFKKRKL